MNRKRVERQRRADAVAEVGARGEPRERARRARRRRAGGAGACQTRPGPGAPRVVEPAHLHRGRGEARLVGVGIEREANGSPSSGAGIALLGDARRRAARAAPPGRGCTRSALARQIELLALLARRRAARPRAPGRAGPAERARLDAQRRERDRAQELEAEPGDRAAAAPRLVALERARDQRRRRAAVQRPRVPRPARLLGREEALAFARLKIRSASAATRPPAA